MFTHVSLEFLTAQKIGFFNGKHMPLGPFIWMLQNQSKGTIWAAMGQGRIHLLESLTLVIYCLSDSSALKPCPVGLTVNYILCVCCNLPAFLMPSGVYFVFFFLFYMAIISLTTLNNSISYKDHSFSVYFLPITQTTYVLLDFT